MVYDFAASRAGELARAFLGDWQGKLVSVDYAGYKAGFGNGIIEIGCMAHARRKFFDLRAANKSQLAAQALEYIGQLYDIEREARGLPPNKRQRLRQERHDPSPMPCINGCSPNGRRCLTARARLGLWATVSNAGRG